MFPAPGGPRARPGRAALWTSDSLRPREAWVAQAETRYTETVRYGTGLEQGQPMIVSVLSNQGQLNRKRLAAAERQAPARPGYSEDSLSAAVHPATGTHHARTIPSATQVAHLNQPGVAPNHGEALAYPIGSYRTVTRASSEGSDWHTGHNDPAYPQCV
eukprot:756069-Hanusia_phi.AAC.2